MSSREIRYTYSDNEVRGFVARAGDTILDGPGDGTIYWKEAVVYQDYDPEDTPFNSPDVALLMLDDEITGPLPELLPRNNGDALFTGQPIATLGSPGSFTNETYELVPPDLSKWHAVRNPAIPEG